MKVTFLSYESPAETMKNVNYFVTVKMALLLNKYRPISAIPFPCRDMPHFLNSAGLYLVLVVLGENNHGMIGPFIKSI